MIEQIMPRTARESRKETFTYNDPQAQNVSLAGDFTEWERNAIPMKRQKNGSWKTTVNLPPGTHEYRFLVDGQWQNDQECQNRRQNGFGAENCVREVE